MYNDFAFIYDRFMRDVNYKEWADYIEKIFEAQNIKPSLILDLGCGTGSFCIEMAKRGYEMIGCDISVDMLSIARSKSDDEGLEILFINQDMADFELYGTVDVIVCLLDSINYLTDKRDLTRMLKLVENYLNPQGLFIFDINTQYKFKEILSDNVYYSVEEDAAYIWQNSYDRETKICEFDLTFFIKSGMLYERYDEIHLERAYSVEELEEYVCNGGMKVIGIYDDLSFSPPGGKSERIFFVSRKQVRGEK